MSNLLSQLIDASDTVTRKKEKKRRRPRSAPPTPPQNHGSVADSTSAHVPVGQATQRKNKSLKEEVKSVEKSHSKRRKRKRSPTCSVLSLLACLLVVLLVVVLIVLIYIMAGNGDDDQKSARVATTVTSVVRQTTKGDKTKEGSTTQKPRKGRHKKGTKHEQTTSTQKETTTVTTTEATTETPLPTEQVLPLLPTSTYTQQAEPTSAKPVHVHDGEFFFVLHGVPGRYHRYPKTGGIENFPEVPSGVECCCTVRVVNGTYYVCSQGMGSSAELGLEMILRSVGNTTYLGVKHASDRMLGSKCKASWH